MVSIGGCGRGSRNWLSGIVFGEFRSEVDRECGSLGWSGSGEVFYGTNVVIGSLERRSGSG